MLHVDSILEEGTVVADHWTWRTGNDFPELLAVVFDRFKIQNKLPLPSCFHARGDPVAGGTSVNESSLLGYTVAHSPCV